MAKRTVTIRGQKKLMAKLGALPRHVDAAGREVVPAETNDVADDMRRNAPFKTGKLKEGIQAEFDRATIQGRAVSTAEHSTYVVHGTSKMEAQDFITPAAVRSQRRFRPRLIRAINQRLGKL